MHCLSSRGTGRGERGVLLDDRNILAEVGLVGGERGRVMVLAKGLKGRDGGLDHGDVARLEDLFEDAEDT